MSDKPTISRRAGRPSIADRILGKARAARELYRFILHLRVWRTVWAAYRIGRPVPSPLHLRSGLTIRFGDEDDPIQLFNEIVVGRCYIPRWFYRPNAGECVVDLGANIGVFALMASREIEHVQFHCFEPASSSRGWLEQNLRENGFADTTKVYPYAVAGAAGDVILKTGASSIHRSLHANAMEGESAGETVRAVTLADALTMTGADRVDLLKVDIEGAELDAFAACPADALTGVRRVVVEYHDHFRPGALGAVRSKLSEAGFSDAKVVAAGIGCGLIYARRPS